MRRILNPLLLWFAQAHEGELIRQLQYLKLENQILRSKLGRQVQVTDQERRRLVKYGLLVGPAIRQLISIVTAKTWERWIGGETWRKGNRPRKPGRPRTPAELERLVLRIARETSWGYARILGELKKLGIGGISRSTVVNILTRHNLEPGPERGPQTWDDFIRRHAQTLWACDFFTKKVLTLRGWREAYVLAFINIQTRRVHVAPSTSRPTRWWTATQAAWFCKGQQCGPHSPSLVIRDRDSKFGPSFEHALSLYDAKSYRVEHRGPNMNAYAERLVQTVKVECLDYFVPFGLKHLDQILAEFLEYYHEDRPHQSLGNAPLVDASSIPARASPVKPRDILCRERLGGLLRSYGWKAAA